MKCLLKCSSSQETPLPWKIPGCAPVMSIIVDICSWFFKSRHGEAFFKIRCPAEKSTLSCSCTTLAVKNLKITCKGVNLSAVAGFQLATTYNEILHRYFFKISGGHCCCFVEHLSMAVLQFFVLLFRNRCSAKQLLIAAVFFCDIFYDVTLFLSHCGWSSNLLHAK